MRLVFFLFLLIFFLTLGTNAQQESTFNQFFQIPQYFNPAAIAVKNRPQSAYIYRHQWYNTSSSFKTHYVSAGSPLYVLPLKLNVGYYHDELTAFNTSDVHLKLAYSIKIKEVTLNAGLGAHYMAAKLDRSKLVFYQPDPLLQKSLNGNTFDCSAGVFAEHEFWYLGISGTRLTEAKYGDANFYQNHQHYYFQGRAYIPLETMKIRPGMGWLYDATRSKGNFLTGDFNIVFLLKIIDRFELGGGFSTRQTIIMNASYDHSKFLLGVSYSKLNSYYTTFRGNSFDVTCAYRFTRFEEKLVKNKNGAGK